MHREYTLFNGFRKARKVFTAGFHVPLTSTPEGSGRGLVVRVLDSESGL